MGLTNPANQSTMFGMEYKVGNVPELRNLKSTHSLIPEPFFFVSQTTVWAKGLYEGTIIHPSTPHLSAYQLPHEDLRNSIKSN